MPSTYIDLCNKVLRRLNEVEIAVDEFGGVRGVQALVKDAVKEAVAKINQAEFEWPFNAAEHQMTLTAGRTEYDWPDFFKISDWNSFQIQKDDGLNIGFKTLRYMERDEWYRNHRDADYDAGSAGRGVPEYVFASHGEGFGVSPSPDRAFSIRFRYFLTYTDLSASSDVTRIPSNFDSLIVDGALFHMYMFKDNPESAQIALQAFERGLRDLQILYIGNMGSIRDTRVRF